MADRIWLWSQTAAFVVVAIATGIGIWLTSGDNHIENEFIVSINANAFGPGLLLSLAVNQVVLLLRRPRRTTMADRIVLSIEYFLIATLIVCNISPITGVLAAGLSVFSLLAALASLIVIIVGNVNARQLTRYAR